jgi:hemerythrin-like domain-containing protein
VFWSLPSPDGIELAHQNGKTEKGKRVNIVSSFLVQDHRKIDELFLAFLNLPEEAGSAGPVILRYEHELKRHMEMEEKFLFPLFERHTGMVNFGPTRVMHVEHVHFRTILKEIHQQLVEGNSPLGLGHELYQSLAGHNRNEETVLYPWIDDHLSDAEAQELIEQMHAMREHDADQNS